MNNQFKKFSITFTHILCLSVIIFLFLNSLKTIVINYFVAYSTFIPINKIISPKSLLLFLLNLAIFLALFRLKNRFFLSAFYILQTIYLFTHLAYFLFFDSIFHIRQFVWQFSEGSAIIKNFLIPKDTRYLIVFFDLPFFLFILINFFRLNAFTRAHRRAINSLSVLSLAFAFFLISFFLRIEDIRRIINDRHAGEKDIIRKYSLFTNDLLDLLLYRNERLLVKNFEYGEKIIFRNKIERKFKNIICIQVEALDPGVIYSRYNGEYITPFLHRLSSQCIYYPYMLGYNRAGSSSDTEFEIMNSVIPLGNFPSLKLRNYNYPNSIIKELLKSNFEVLAFHNNVGAFFNREVSYLQMGFQNFFDLKKMKLEAKGWGAADHDMLNYVKNKLQKQKKPFLYYIITMSSHVPYRLAKRYYVNKQYNNIDEHLIRDYFNAMAYVDKVLEDFVSFVQNTTKDTCIFIYSDGPAPCFKGSVIYCGKEKLGCSPLFIITPDNKKYAEKDQVVSTLDLGLSILYASEISFEIMTKGVNLLDFPNKEALVPIAKSKKRSRKYLFNQVIKNEFTNSP